MLPTESQPHRLQTPQRLPGIRMSKRERKKEEENIKINKADKVAKTWLIPKELIQSTYIHIDTEQRTFLSVSLIIFFYKSTLRSV